MKTVSKMLIVVSAIALDRAPHAWSAPKVPVAQVQPADEIKTETITLKHVPPSVMKQWLESPWEAIFHRLERVPHTQLYSRDAQSHLTVLTNDETSEITISTTATNLDPVRQTIQLLDEPRRSVLFEIQSVLMNTSDMGQLLPNSAGRIEHFMSSSRSGEIWSLGANSASYKATLASLVASKRVAAVQKREQIVMNRDWALLQSSIRKAEKDLTLSEMISSTSQKQTPTLFWFSVRPTIGSNGWIQCTTNAGSFKDAWISGMQMRNEETIVFSERRPGQLPTQITLTFVTPRIIRRADEKK